MRHRGRPKAVVLEQWTKGKLKNSIHLMYQILNLPESLAASVSEGDKWTGSVLKNAAHLSTFLDGSISADTWYKWAPSKPNLQVSLQSFSCHLFGTRKALFLWKKKVLEIKLGSFASSQNFISLRIWLKCSILILHVKENTVALLVSSLAIQ
jgi:hypothetical protein